MPKSGRFAALDQREINRETFVEPWPEAGLAVVDSPYDPEPSLLIQDGRVVEMDGKARSAFDTLDAFIANHALDVEIGPQAMATSSLALARMIVDINVPPADVRRLAAGCTPALRPSSPT